MTLWSSNERLLYAITDYGDWGDIDELAFFTFSELIEWAVDAGYTDVDDYLKEYGDDLPSIVKTRTGRNLGVLPSVPDAVL